MVVYYLIKCDCNQWSIKTSYRALKKENRPRFSCPFCYQENRIFRVRKKPLTFLGPFEYSNLARDRLMLIRNEERLKHEEHKAIAKKIAKRDEERKKLMEEYE